MAEAWRAVITPHAQRDLKKLAPLVRDRVVSEIEALAAGDERSEVRKLRGLREPTWRLRVGDWRVLFARDAQARELIVLAVRHRARAY